MNVESSSSSSNLVNIVKSKLIAKHKADWSAALLESRNNHTGKLRTYSLFKQRLCREPYIEHIKDRRIRRCFTKLRISCHKLEIEIGRYKKISAESRLCPVCKTDNVEDEIHFPTECPAFSVERNVLFNSISKMCKNFTSMSNFQTFIWLSSNGNANVLRVFAQFVYDFLL